MNNAPVSNLLEALAAALERPRAITAQVIHHLVSTHGIGRDQIGAFLAGELPKLEDYEIDLILSPLFTPTLKDQSVFAEGLGRESVPRTEWPGLVQQLAGRPTRAQLVTDDGQTHVVPLREVTIERFVHRLRLDGTIPGPLFEAINHLAPAADRPLLKAIARRAVWEEAGRRQILVAYLTTAASGEAYRLADAVDLLKLTETYEPADVGDLLARIPHWQQVLLQEINEATGPKPFFNERVQEMHGGGRDQRRQDHSRVSAMENERAFLDRLQRVLASGAAASR
jgi:hypothetical protein